MPTQTIGIINFKGGVCKTTTTIHLGAALAELGRRVLLVDCDPQGCVALHLGVDRDALSAGIEDVLAGRTDLASIVVEARPDLFVAPSRRELFDARARLLTRRGADGLLARALKPVRADYDFILIDSPPDEGILSVNAMFAADWLLVPTTLKAWSVAAINRVLENRAEMEEVNDRQWPILGIVVSAYHAGHRGENGLQLDSLDEGFGEDGLVCRTRVRVDEAFPRASREGKSVLELEPRSKGAADFRELAAELLDRVRTDARVAA